MSKRPMTKADVTVYRIRSAMLKTFPALDLVSAGIDFVQDPSLSGANRVIKTWKRLAGK